MSLGGLNPTRSHAKETRHADEEWIDENHSRVIQIPLLPPFFFLFSILYRIIRITKYRPHAHFTSRESHRALHGPGAFLPVRLLRIQSKGSLHPCQQPYIRPSQQLGHQDREQACSKLSSEIQSQVSGGKEDAILRQTFEWNIFFLSFFEVLCSTSYPRDFRFAYINFYRVKCLLFLIKVLNYLRGKI